MSLILNPSYNALIYQISESLISEHHGKRKSELWPVIQIFRSRHVCAYYYYYFSVCLDTNQS